TRATTARSSSTPTATTSSSSTTTAESPGRTHVRPVSLTPYAVRRADRPRRPRAQPQGRDRPPAAEPPDLHHGPLRLGQVVARVRHDLRRGAAAVRRVAERV